jgi:protein associated with RNAse G/E
VFNVYETVMITAQRSNTAVGMKGKKQVSNLIGRKRITDDPYHVYASVRKVYNVIHFVSQEK